MTRDELLGKLRTARAELDRLVAAIPADRLERPAPGTTHSPKDIVYHVAAYDDLMVRRLRCARDGETTAFDRDRDSWEAFNERIWADAAEKDAPAVLAWASKTFLDLVEEVGRLAEDELNGDAGLVKHIDPGWLQGRPLAEVIGVDGFDHYPMHYAVLKAAGEDVT